MQIAELKQLVEWLEQADIGSFEIESADCRLRLSLHRGNAPLSAPSLVVDCRGDAVIDDGIIVTAALPGSFVVQHPMSSAPLGRLGEQVQEGDIVGLIEVGSIYTPVAAPANGRLVGMLAVPEALVDFGTPLFQIQPPEAAARA